MNVEQSLEKKMNLGYIEVRLEHKQVNQGRKEVNLEHMEENLEHRQVKFEHMEVNRRTAVNKQVNKEHTEVIQVYFF